MNEMVERIARALCTEAGHDPDGDDLWNFGRSHEIKKKNWEAHIGGARAAIASMREPTEGMCRSVKLQLGTDDNHKPVMLELGEVEDVWQAMVDEALK